MIVSKSVRVFSIFGFLGLLFSGLILLTGCDPAEIGDLLDPEVTDGRVEQSVPGANVGESVPPASHQGPLVIGSYNIQTFGRSKMSKPDVVKVLTDIARRFDILAIQELRDINEGTIPAFLQSINRNGAHYAAAVSRRVGYTDSKTNNQYEEQMVYVYDAARVEIISEPYVAQDRYKIMHRPPYVAHFRCRDLPRDQAFSFVLMNVHVDPDDTEVEFDALQGIIGSLFPNHYGEDDFILLGDLNDDATAFKKYHWMANQFATIPSHWKTNTRQKESYDNLVFDARRTAEFMNQGGVMNVEQEYGLSREQALEVSDHLPVWGVFSTREVQATEMTQGPQVLR